jgi:hypothetical protein
MHSNSSLGIEGGFIPGINPSINTINIKEDSIMIGAPQPSISKPAKESSTFLSKTTRNQVIPESPGPGHYNAEFKHIVVKRNPENFGSSTEKKSTHFLNSDCPFIESTHIRTPAVGTYGQGSSPIASVATIAGLVALKSDNSK